MAHRNFERLIEEGEKLEKQSAAFAGLYANEARKLYDLREDTLQLIETAYRAGLADGYRLRKKEERRQAEAAAQRRLKQAKKIRRALFFEAGWKLGHSQAEIEMLLEYEAGKKGGEA